MDDYTDITGPVYGEEKKTAVYITYAILFLLFVWTGYCVIIAVVYGILGNWEHFGFAILMILTFIHLLVSFGLYKKSDQEEKKFLINCIICVIIVIVSGIVLNCYVWAMVANSCDCESSTNTNSTTTTTTTTCPQYIFCDPNDTCDISSQCLSCNTTSASPGKMLYQQLYGSRL